MVTSLAVVAVSNGYSFPKTISVLPKALLIINAVNFVIMPVVDLIENYKDRKMCTDLNQDYESDFLFSYDVKQKENIRYNFKELNNYNGFTLEVLSKSKANSGT